ncbi:MAG: DsbA family protein [Henriciella sp.]|nr:DsbA family protein [Henriciella sp.]
MGLKDRIQNKVVRHLFGTERRNAKRKKAEHRRKRAGLPHHVEYFHEAGDPYSHLVAQVLPIFYERYDVDLEVHLVAPPADWAAPDRDRLHLNSRRDAARLAQRAGLKFDDPGDQPTASALHVANSELLDAIRSGAFVLRAQEIGRKLWSGGDLSAAANSEQAVRSALTASAEQRDKLGHYLGGTLYYAGEWYWGLDRLHFLEERLKELGAANAPDAPFIFNPPVVPSGSSSLSESKRPELHWYLSFRSPYTGIVADRVKALADAYNANLKLRFVLPMVMRGMQVPRMKGFYIMSDTAREAERQNIPFGNLFDPVGEPVERGYAILHRAIELGRGFEFAQSFLSGVWSEGLNARTDRDLKIITERSGLSWSEMKPLIGGDHWRADAEANQQEMFSHGLWGVPSFRVGDVAAWGQDRLWVVEDALKAVTHNK